MLKGGGGNFAAELPEAQQKGVKAGMVWYLGTGMDIKNHLFSQRGQTEHRVIIFCSSQLTVTDKS